MTAQVLPFRMSIEAALRALNTQAQTVVCPICRVPPGCPCDMSDSGVVSQSFGYHVDRLDLSNE